MRIRKNGIYKNVPSSELGLWQSMGYEKVINEPLPKLEEVAPKVEPEIKDEPIVEEMPKSKKNGKK